MSNIHGRFYLLPHAVNDDRLRIRKRNWLETWSEMEASDYDDEDTREAKLHMLLDLHRGADYCMMPALTSQVEDKILVAGQMFITIKNIDEIRERAEYVGARAIEEMCIQFIEDNRDVVERATTGSLE